MISKTASKVWIYKKGNAINQILQNRTVFYFLLSHILWAKGQNPPLGHHQFSSCHQSARWYSTEWSLRWVSTLLPLWRELRGQRKDDVSERNIIKWINKWTNEYTSRYICEAGIVASLSQQPPSSSVPQPALFLANHLTWRYTGSQGEKSKGVSQNSPIFHQAQWGETYVMGTLPMSHVLRYSKAGKSRYEDYLL